MFAFLYYYILFVIIFIIFERTLWTCAIYVTLTSSHPVCSQPCGGGPLTPAEIGLLETGENTLVSPVGSKRPVLKIREHHRFNCDRKTKKPDFWASETTILTGVMSAHHNTVQQHLAASANKRTALSHHVRTSRSRHPSLHSFSPSVTPSNCRGRGVTAWPTSSASCRSDSLL